MKAVYQGKEGNTVTFNFEIEAEDFEKSLQATYLKNRGRFNIPGFRKGKAPRKIIETNYGEGIFYDEAINEILPEAYENAIEELALEPVDRPEVDIDEIEKGQPLLVKITVDVKPEVKLGDYSSIELEKIEYNVTDEMVEEKVKELQDSNSRLIDVSDREVKEGDILTIDFEGYSEGEQFPGGTAEGYKLEIGSNSFIPGFEDQLIGKKNGEELEVNVKFPEEYHEESLAGKDAMFKVTIHDMKAKELPEIDDEFVKDVSEFDTLDELKNDIREKLEKDLKEQEKVETENRIVEKLIEISEVDIPRGMIESQIDDEVRQFDFRMRNQGLELDQYLQYTGMKIEDIRNQMEPVASQRVNAELVLEAVGKAEGVEVSDEDLDIELEKLAGEYKAEDKDDFIKRMKEGDLEFLKSGIINSKVIDLLIEKVKFN